jgi:dTDP-glucose 4,6-dehydratase
MKSKTILITGGAGFIGSHFVEHVYRTKPDWTILVLDCLTYAGSLNNISDEIKASKRFEFWYGNVTNSDLVSTLTSRSDYVVHFAAESHVARSIFDNRVFFETDVIGTQCVANAVKKYARTVSRMIHISTSEVYGTALTQPMTEEHPLNPMSPYAAAKAGADRLVYAYVETYKIPAVILRPFNQFGPCQHLEKLVPRVITSILKGETIHVHGDGKQKRDWAFVTDTCCNIMTVLDSPGFQALCGQAINIGTGQVFSVDEILRMVLDLCSTTSVEISSIGDRPGNVRLHVSSTDKFERLFGKLQISDIRAAMKQTLQWYRDNENRWRDQRYFKTIPIYSVDGEVEYH